MAKRVCKRCGQHPPSPFGVSVLGNRGLCLGCAREDNVKHAEMNGLNAEAKLEVKW